MDSIRNTCRAAGRILIAALLFIGMVAVCQNVLAASAQKSFPTPEEAVKALMAATKAHDTKGMQAILGPESKSVLDSGDAIEDKGARERFFKSHEEASKLEKVSETRMTLAVGKDQWPFPIPIIKDANGWRFDAKQGKEELINRRVGKNELAAMQAVLAYVDAQREYYLANPAKDKLLTYAQKVVSTAGKRDGLYYPTNTGEKPSPLGPAYGRARAAGYKEGEKGKPAPFHGYYFRILKGQGPDAPGGAYDYIANGKMIGGHAIVAYPAQYGNSGVMTFMTNHKGAVYEKDLGPNTASAAAKITKFNPDKTWKVVDVK